MEVGGGGGGDKSRKKIPHEIINIKKFLWILTKKSLKPRRKKKKDFYLASTKEKNLAPSKSPPLPLITFLMVHSFISNYPYFFLS